MLRMIGPVANGKMIVPNRSGAERMRNQRKSQTWGLGSLSSIAPELEPLVLILLLLILLLLDWLYGVLQSQLDTDSRRIFMPRKD